MTRFKVSVLDIEKVLAYVCMNLPHTRRFHVCQFNFYQEDTRCAAAVKSQNCEKHSLKAKDAKASLIDIKHLQNSTKRPL